MGGWTGGAEILQNEWRVDFWTGAAVWIGVPAETGLKCAVEGIDGMGLAFGLARCALKSFCSVVSAESLDALLVSGLESWTRE